MASISVSRGQQVDAGTELAASERLLPALPPSISSCASTAVRSIPYNGLSHGKQRNFQLPTAKRLGLDMGVGSWEFSLDDIPYAPLGASHLDAGHRFAIIGGYLGQVMAKDDTVPAPPRVSKTSVSLVLNNYVEEVDVKKAMRGAMNGLADNLDADSGFLPANVASAYETNAPSPPPTSASS
jgi:hypothetical protein